MKALSEFAFIQSNNKSKNLKMTIFLELCLRTEPQFFRCKRINYNHYTQHRFMKISDEGLCK